MTDRSTLEEVLAAAARDRPLGRGIVRWERLPARPARLAPFPPCLDGRWREALARHGIRALYSHQAAVLDAVRHGADPVITTPTASGKSLCYHLPVVDTLLRDPPATALYVFPAKALVRDQEAALRALTAGLLPPDAVGAYDGDTPPATRRALRAVGRAILTNPDMLHRAILPHHAAWERFLRGLRFVVLDEMHAYHGLFGGHVANVLRRLERVTRLRGARPGFLCGSATIANPLELAHALTGRHAVHVNEDGAPRGEKHLIIYNPFHAGCGGRPGAVHLSHTAGWARRFIDRGIRTIVFARTRRDVERLVGDLRAGGAAVCGYRADYLPEERRARETWLRDGAMGGVVATNALELGVDVGSLDAAVLAGYPGSLAAAWQQAGRVGRRSGPSAVVLVAGPGPLDQYLARHPEYLRQGPPEHAHVDPDNPFLLAAHLECAAAEHPLRPGEALGSLNAAEVVSVLVRTGRLRRSGAGWTATAAQPARAVDLRRATGARVVVRDMTEAARPLASVDAAMAPLFLYEGAVYLHDGRPYRVEGLDLAAGQALVKPAATDEETGTRGEARVELLTPGGGSPGGETPEWGWGRAKVSIRPAAYVRRDRRTGAVTGWGRVTTPGAAMETMAYWYAFPARWNRLPRHVLAGAAAGLVRLLSSLAPLHLLCGPGDLLTAWQAPAPDTGRPTIYLCDAWPGGVGLAPRLAGLHPGIAAAAARVIRRCPCGAGCPACLGPVGSAARRAALAMLEASLDRSAAGIT